MAEQDKYQESVEDEVIKVEDQAPPAGGPAPTPSPQVAPEPKPEAPQPKVEAEPVPSPAPAPSVSPAPAPEPKPGPDPAKANQIKALTDMAFEKGVDAAIEEAKKLGNPYILDEFHDILVDELYKKLVEAGKLEQR